MKILITYDFISSSNLWGKEFTKRFDFIYKLLKYLDVEIVFDDCTFNRKFFFESNEEIFNEENLKILSKCEITKDSLNYIKEYCISYNLLIGYEFSHRTKEILDELNIKYIDIWLSPIRFCEDFMFEFYSNDSKINQRIKEYKYKEKDITKRAQKIINQVYFFHEKKNVLIENNSALIVGQLFKDKAVYQDGKFLNLIDFKSEIFKLSKKYAKIYFLKHPLMKETDFLSIVKTYKVLDNFEYLENQNVYELLSLNEIKSVYAISSSVLTESVYFKKQVKYFYKPVIDERYTRVFKSYYLTSFWKNLFNLETNKKDIEYMVDDNYLRYKYDAFYAYDKFLEEQRNKNERNYNKIVNFYLYLDSLPKDKEYILYGYGSVGKLIKSYMGENIVSIIDKNLNKKEIDGIKVISEAELLKVSNVIISPFKYNQEILNSLKKYHCKLYCIEI